MSPPVATLPEVTIVGQTNPAALDSPDLESISILLPDTGVSYPHFLAYEYDENYLTPCAKFWFDLDVDELQPTDIASLVPGAPVQVQVNGLTQCSGIIDETPVRTGRGGSVLHVEGRDWMSVYLDSQIPPWVQFSPTMTIEQFINAAVYSVVDPSIGNLVILDSNAQNVSLQTGATRGLRASRTTGKTSNSTLAHQVQPYPNEHCFEFIARVCQREGLWVRPTTTPYQVTVTAPNYDQDPLYTFLHSTADASSNNIEGGTVTPSRKDQPAILFAYGTGGGGEFAATAIRCAILNPFIESDTSYLLGLYPKVPLVSLGSIPYASGRPIITDQAARALWKEDPESHTQSEIEAYARREMSLLMRRSLGIRYEIMGHTLGGYPIALDTMATVRDDRSNLNGQFWMMGRNFSKKADGGGTRTMAELITPGALTF